MKNTTNWIIAFCIILISPICKLQSQTSYSTYAGQTTTWTAPACIKEVTVVCIGGGGAGGSATQNALLGSASAGGGGAGGAYVEKVVTVVPGNTYSLSAASAQATSGAAGADTWFINNTTVLAKGGAGGANAGDGASGVGGTGTSTGSIGTLIRAGGNGAAGTTGGAGGGGGGGANGGGVGGNASGGTGGIAGAGGSVGAAGGTGTAGAVGTAGGNYGGGGSGGSTNAGGTNAGGAGGLGVIILSYSTNPTRVNNASICSGQSVVLTATGATSYVWAPGGQTTNTISVSPTETTTYSVTGTDGSCSGTIVSTVLVYSPVSVSSPTICTGNAATIYASGSQSYSWSTGATTSTINTATLTANTSYTVTGTSCGINSTAIASVTVDNCVSQTFTTGGAGTWTAPSCVSSVVVEAWGGGGGGGGGTNNDNSGGGGGGGGYSKSASIPVIGGTTYNYMVGVGGAAGNQAAGGAGGNTWFNTSTTVLARGGAGGSSGGNTTSAGGAIGIGAVTYAGGNGGADYSNATNGAGGGGGSSAGPSANGKNGTSAANGVTDAAGGIAVSGGGVGGDGCGQGGALLPDCAGSAGTAPGGGGGGGNDDNSARGGAGGAGKLIITYKVSPPTVAVTGGGAICTGQSLTLTATGATNYSWSPGTGLSATTGASVVANPTTTTTFTVTASNPGCTVTPTATSVVTFTTCCTNATLSLSSAAGSDAQTVCTNSAITNITYAIGGGGTGATVSATLPAGVTGTYNAGVYTISGTPTAIGTFGYTVTTSGGCAPLTAVGSITTGLPTAFISGSTTVCQNDASPDIIFTGSTGAPPYIFTYSIDGGPNQTVSTAIGSNTVSVAAPTSASGTFVYSLVDVSSGGCSQVQNGSEAITVNPLPTATISGTTNVILNDPNPVITFTGANGTAPYTFSYTLDGGAIQTITSIGATATLSAPTTVQGTFTYSLLGVQDASTTLCTQTQTGSAIVIVSTMTGNVTGSTVLCEGAPNPVVTFTGAGGTASYTFTYSVNGGAAQTISSVAPSNTATLSVSTSVATTYVYDLMDVTDANNSTASTMSSVTIIVNPLPTATIGGSTTVCRNTANPTITLTGANGTAPYTFTYTLNGGANQTITTVAGNSATLSAPTTTAGTFTYSLVSVQDANCSQNQTVTAIVVINPAPNATISGNNTVCLNSASPNITFTGSDGNPDYMFSYNIDGGATQTASTTGGGSVVTVAVPTTASGTFVYSLTGIQDAAASACGAATGSVSITVEEPPTAVAVGSGTLCEVGSHTVSGTSSQYGTIMWAHNGAGSLSNPISLTPTYTAGSGDAGNAVTLTMTVTSTNSCAPQIATANYIVTVDALPTATAGGIATICQDATHTLIGATATNGSILWTENGAGSITAGVNTLTPTYTAAAADAGSVVTLTMTVTSTNSCNPQTATAFYTINVDHLPTAVSGGNSIICQNKSYTLGAVEASQQYGSIAWTHNGTGTISSGGTSLTPTYTAAAGDAGSVVTLTMTVTSTNSCNPASAQANYAIQVDPLPAAVSGGTAVICENSTYTLQNGEATNSFGTILWTENEAGVITSGAQSLTPTYGAAANDAGKIIVLVLTVTSNNGCVGETDTAQFRIKVDSLPIATAGGNTAICENGSTTVIGAGSKNGNIVWSTAGAGNIVSGNTLTPTYQAAGADAGSTIILRMTVTSNNACNPNTATADYSVKVDPLPIATIFGNGNICANKTITLGGGVASALYGSISWSEDGFGNITAGANSLTPTYVADLSDGGRTVNMTMTVSSTNACVSEVATAVFPVVVNAIPSAAILGTTTVCMGGAPPNMTITGTGATPFQFNYSINGGALLTDATTSGNSVSIPVNTASDGTFNYVLSQVTDGLGCVQDLSSLGISAAVKVNKLPEAILATSATVCQHVATAPTLTLTGSNGANNYPYTFTYNIESASGTQVNSITTTSGNKAFITAPVDVPGTFKYRITDVSYNQGAYCSNAQNDTSTIVVNPLPLATMSGGGEICKDSLAPSVTFVGSGGTAPYVFTFKMNDKESTVVSDMNGQFTLIGSSENVGTFNYTLLSIKDSNQCSSILTSNVVPIVVHENPYPNFTIDQEVASTLRSKITITDASIASDIYFWDFGDGKFSSSADPGSHTYADSGSYKITLTTTTDFGCKRATSQVVIIEMPLTLYVPNTFTPNGDGLNDVFLAKADGWIRFKMMIFDRWGNMIFYSDDINKGWDGKANGGSSMAQEDVYVYVVTGTDLKKHDTTYRGTVNLVR